MDLMGLLPMIVIIALMYFMLIRPSQKQRKKQQEMQNALSRGNKVVTIGGLHGTVEAIDDSTVVLSIEDGSKVRFERAAIQRVLEGEGVSLTK
ncbi:preprotein translocase subunit YajC [Kurthia sp. 3B1D]|uniref:Preprotein translocase subunit YajC n=2 Tax=Kurthia TaxID=1649 RepID=A0A433RRY3_9BACL|nr:MULTISPECIES: preprotein translocase subunit YajC [unclassified Kurthia]RUS54365.1 preprotein translocase subunit YajC [Kurthia sp. 3B1D]HIX44003.1 preprotein translocase subunit YajC [Candidatus Kurthia intestinigallinarum]